MRLILLIAASLVASCAGVMPARIGERREPVNRSDLRRQSPEATEILLLQSNVKCEFSIDDKFLTTGQYDVRVLVTFEWHKVTCKPEGYIAKDAYVQPPFSQTSPIGFMFLPDDPGPVDYNVLKRGVVKIIKNGEETGAGIVVGIDKNTAFILTAYHVVGNSQRIEVMFGGKQWEKFIGRLFQKYLEDLDLAVITVNLVGGGRVPSDLPKLSVGDLSELREGQKVLTIGHPGAFDWDISKDINTIKIIEKLSEPTDSRKFRFTPTGIAPGSSGGPVFNAQGSIIGMVISSGAHAIAVNIDEARTVLREWGIPTTNLTRP